VNDLIDLIFGV